MPINCLLDLDSSNICDASVLDSEIYVEVWFGSAIKEIIEFKYKLI